ncbi:hypothetical protein I553_4082 [Mycobacterium xenopi 4042]|uniref:Uncharacterized protein n=1 Tax=Mycobacterium xenopi 4042 TaxID=1299334 RepID=X8AE95_MYCXE|nr:hypothetical protein I553_4082 [Mycobacterium xenopi 4042]
MTFLVGGVCLLFGLNRIRPTPRRLVQSFGLFNVVFAQSCGRRRGMAGCR